VSPPLMRCLGATTVMATAKRSPVSRPNPRTVRAEQTRRRMLDVARDLYVANGYAGTTIEAIAERAEVGVQTVYFTFNNKRNILKEIVDVAVAGDQDPVPTLQRPWARHAAAAPDAAEQLRHQARGAREIYRRVGPILEVVRNAAASEPHIASLWETNKQQRYFVQSELAEILKAKPGYRGPSDSRRLADILYAMLGPEMFHLLSVDRRWPLARCERWVADALCAQLTTAA
jgi:AcrR family transcriptional regulator